MVLKDGSKALWRGLPPTLWRDVPFSAIYWMGYEECKFAIEASNNMALNDLQVSFAAGAMSGMVCIFTLLLKPCINLFYSLLLPLQHHLMLQRQEDKLMLEEIYLH